MPRRRQPKHPRSGTLLTPDAAPEDAELADALDTLGNPAATTLERVRHVGSAEFIIWANDRKNRRVVPFRSSGAAIAQYATPTPSTVCGRSTGAGRRCTPTTSYRHEKS